MRNSLHKTANRSVNVTTRYDNTGCKALFALLLFSLCLTHDAASADDGGYPDINGIWLLNEDLSDNTDKQVEKAIKAAGGRIKRSKKKGKYRYKGGPVEQELYDHLSYDEAFHFHYDAPKFTLTYLDDFSRVFYSDGRGRTVSASDEKHGDYAFASWDSGILYVEARPRDGGRTFEVYHLLDAGNRLKVELELQPVGFTVPVKVTRIYDRKQ